MANNGAISNGPPPMASSYRVKFLRNDFLNLVKITKPEFIFHVQRMYFFALQGFVVYSLECRTEDFNNSEIPILEAIEFSNRPWSE